MAGTRSGTVAGHNLAINGIKEQQDYFAAG
jgi:hypothetical protein